MSLRQALSLTGISRGTWHYRSKPRAPKEDPIPQSQRAYPSRLSVSEVAEIQTLIHQAWQADRSVSWAYVTAWEAGRMLGSLRTWWRIAAMMDQTDRPVVCRRQTVRQRVAPVLEATRVGQVWSWDITDLLGPYQRVTYKVYTVIDIYSRQIVAHRVEEREADVLAVEMFAEAFEREGRPEVVHSDSGPAMRSNALKELCADFGVEQTFNRPRVSNDNPYSESAFNTMKSRPHYPRFFNSLEEARAYIDEFVAWYNSSHKHSGIALFSPEEVHTGKWEELWERRDETLQAYYQAHPERFHQRPRTPRPGPCVGINLPAAQPATDTP